MLIQADVTRPEGISQVIAAMRARLPGRGGVLSIPHDNVAFPRTHGKMGMREVARFAHGGAEMAVLAHVG